jgi:hypothetical protein
MVVHVCVGACVHTHAHAHARVKGFAACIRQSAPAHRPARRNFSPGLPPPPPPTPRQASPLQCVPLADSCLALGAAACRGAVARIGELVAAGELGPKAAGARVIYAQARARKPVEGRGAV